MEKVGSSVLGAWPILGAKILDVLASSASIITFLFIALSVFQEFHKVMEVQHYISEVPLSLCLMQWVLLGVNSNTVPCISKL